MPVEQIFSFTAGTHHKLGIQIGVVLVVLALLIISINAIEHEKSLKMSKQDIKDEYKKSEGDPLIKGRSGATTQNGHAANDAGST